MRPTRLQIYTGLVPFHELNDFACAIALIQGKHPQRSWSAREIPDCLWDTMKACWKLHPENRPRTHAPRSYLLEGLLQAMPLPRGRNLESAPEVKTAAIVRATFVPCLSDELYVTFGEDLAILEEYEDGWALCSNSQLKTGVVPIFCLNKESISAIARRPTHIVESAAMKNEQPAVPENHRDDRNFHLPDIRRHSDIGVFWKSDNLALTGVISDTLENTPCDVKGSPSMTPSTYLSDDGEQDSDLEGVVWAI